MGKSRKYSRQPSQSNPRRWLTIGLATLGVLALFALVGYAFSQATQPAPVLGESVPIAGADHIPEDQKATDYNSDPPTSGQHYATPAEAGFYEEAPPDEQLVHNLEHGHIVVYYNCTLLNDDDCQRLKEGLQQAMGAAGVAQNTGTQKIEIVPRTSMDNLVTYTSWGRLYRADTFERDEFLTYVEQNRNRAPEPNAP
jgi:hypothetical protein